MNSSTKKLTKPRRLIMEDLVKCFIIQELFQELDAKLKASEVNKSLIMQKTKEEVKAHLAKVEQKVKDLEGLTEAEKIAKKFAMDANIMKVDEKRSEQMERRMKEIQEHANIMKVDEKRSEQME